MSQETYIKMILERFRRHNFKLIDTPIEKGHSLNLKDCPKSEKEKREIARVPYASAVGSLMYAMLCTQPDICFTIGMATRYQSNPGPVHWQAVKRIFQYLCRTSNLILCYQGGDLRLRGYSDAH